MAEKAVTGGEKEFVYEKKNLERIRREDTESTSAFKKRLAEHYEQKSREKELQKARFEYIKRTAIMASLISIAIIAISVVLVLLNKH